MATAELPSGEYARERRQARTRAKTESSALVQVWAFCASLKVTVVLLALLIILVFAGTLAQVKHDVWHVVGNTYFRVWVAKIELQTVPTLMGVFKPNTVEIPSRYFVPFPGGYTIGLLMLVNLLAAHSFRYKVVARGNRMVWALALLTAGVAATWWVLVRAIDSPDASSISPQFAELLWNLCRGGYAALTLVFAYGLSMAWGNIRRPEWFTLAGLNVVLLAAAIYLFVDPAWRIPDAGMRIVWQSMQATAAGGLLMGAAWLLFDKRSGVMLLHLGIVVLMLHEFYVAQTNVETNMIVGTGETVSWVYNPNKSELVVIDRSKEDVDRVVSIPAALVAEAAAARIDSPARVIRSPQLPVDIRVLDYYRFSDAVPRDASTATSDLKGSAAKMVLRSFDGGPNADRPGANIEILDKKSGESLGKYLVTTFFDAPRLVEYGPALLNMPGFPGRSGEQTIEGGDKNLWIAMRQERSYKPYSVTLDKFSFERYEGTNKPKNYSSDVRLVDAERSTEIDFHIAMNSPLRYHGETLYQSSFDGATETTTVLQIVENDGWMAPYIGCAMVAVGMVVHFLITLLRFLNRRHRELDSEEPPRYSSTLDWFFRPAVLVPTFAALLTASYLASKFRTPNVEVDGMRLNEVALLPVLDEGRVKPLDSLARNTLQFLSERQEAKISKNSKPTPAIQWFMDVVSGRREAKNYCVFRITNPELLSTLGLKSKPGFYRYSVAELRDTMEKLAPQVDKARAADGKPRTPFQEAVVDLVTKLNVYSRLVDSFSLPKSIGNIGDPTAMESDRDTLARLRSETPPRPVVPAIADGKWQTLFEANLQQMIARAENRPGNPASLGLAMLIYSYQQGDEKGFAQALSDYQSLVKNYEQELHDPENAAIVAPLKLKTVEQLDNARVRFEAWLNTGSPFYYCAVMYLVAMIIAAASWMFLPQTLGRTSIAIIAVTLVFHTLAIAGRMYISDRPPITNLYTTAICIGWAIVLLMLVFESIFKLGINTFLAALSGFVTLLIGYQLGIDEDTFTVMQAVLDTQFWLATHVTSINLGYGTTLAAGCLGCVYIVAVHMLNLFSEKNTRKLIAMIYGSLCFAILFSFVGTVLGGLWADDSWGRFWGWDPKENGALMIVLWNAIALHARWGKMVGPRGLAMLVVFGNIITAWSWFGVNQLSVGLHAYGFNQELARGLLYFVISQVVVLAIGAIPWRSVFARRMQVA